MALFFRHYLGMFALMATSVLWASCSDADKNADKSREQASAKIECPNDLKKNVDDNRNDNSEPVCGLEEIHFNTNGVEIKVSRIVLLEDSVYNNDVGKIAHILRKKSEALFKIYDSFYKKDVHEQWNHFFLALEVSINENGLVEKVEFDKANNKVDIDFEKIIVEFLKQTYLKNVGKNIVYLSFDFYHPIKETISLAEFLGIPRSIGLLIANGAVIAPTDDELELANGVKHGKTPILRVVRERTHRLRHIYNKHLSKYRTKVSQKNNQDNIDPVFNGIIVFQLNIDADGIVQKIEIQSSNTGNKDFDDDVKNAVSRWNFPKMNSSEVVTFPLTFFKNVTQNGEVRLYTR